MDATQVAQRVDGASGRRTLGLERFRFILWIMVYMHVYRLTLRYSCTLALDLTFNARNGAAGRVSGWGSLAFKLKFR